MSQDAIIIDVALDAPPALVWRARLQAGETLLVHGAAGGTGLAAVELGKQLQARVIACASSAEKMAKLKAMGADEAINYKEVDFSKWAIEKYGKPQRRSYDGGVDVVVNFTGGDTWVPSLKTLHRQGRILTCGATAGFDPKEDLRFIWTFELKVLGSNGWARGDIARVHLKISAQADMTWVVVDDPIPSGALILGSGLGRDAGSLTQGEKREGWAWPTFIERTQEAYRAYYQFVPKGKFKVEYTVRLNNPGRFDLPATRVEALYAPEMFAELPNQTVAVKP